MQFTYTGHTETVYTNVDGSALLAVPGQTYELSQAPDGLWSAVTAPEVNQPEPPKE